GMEKENSPLGTSSFATPNAALSDVAIVLLNYNGAHFLRKFLPGVLAHAAGARVVVADNASTDESQALLQREFPQLVFCAAQLRRGGAAGLAAAALRAAASPPEYCGGAAQNPGLRQPCAI
nr:hypothetical protein [Tanacetum cinerariifolium]